LELCAAFVLGCLDEADRLELEAHRAAGCAACEAEIMKLSGSIVAVAASAPQVEPPAALRARVLELVRREARPQPMARGKLPRLAPRRPAIVAWAWAAAAVVLAIATLSVWRTNEALRGAMA